MKRFEKCIERDNICRTIVYKRRSYQTDIAVHITTFAQRLVISGLIIRRYNHKANTRRYISKNIYRL